MCPYPLFLHVHEPTTTTKLQCHECHELDLQRIMSKPRTTSYSSYSSSSSGDEGEDVNALFNANETLGMVIIVYCALLLWVLYLQQGNSGLEWCSCRSLHFEWYELFVCRHCWLRWNGHMDRRHHPILVYRFSTTHHSTKSNPSRPPIASIHSSMPSFKECDSQRCWGNHRKPFHQCRYLFWRQSM